MVFQCKNRILCVDDEKKVLEGFKLNLGRDFHVYTAQSGEEGLAILNYGDPVRVVISDNRMPIMDGVTFLRQAQSVAPDAIRILLTGHADLDTALLAIDEGRVFRLLTKPCPPERLKQTVYDAVEQFRLVTNDRELMLQKLEVLKAQLLHADRLATLGSITNTVGHELTNISSAFDGFFELLRESSGTGNILTKSDFEILEMIGGQLRTHASHLLNLAKSQSEAKGLIDFGKIVDKTVAMLKTTGVITGTRFSLSLPSNLILVHGHRTQIEQILVNLIKNALDAFDGINDRSAQICVGVLENADRGKVLCRVEDNGCGISEKDLAHIFESYYTTKPPDKGTGLGLSVVKQIVESNGGILSVESREGKGTTFVFELPVFSQSTEKGNGTHGGISQ